MLTDAPTSFKKVLEDATNKKDHSVSKVSNTDYEIKDGSILIAAITSCTNTSNPNVLIGAPIKTFGLDVLVQEVIAAIKIEPSLIS